MRKYVLTYSILCLSGALLLNGCASERKASTSAPLTSNTDRAKVIRDKYSNILGVDAVQIANTSLYNFIDDWYSAPYKYAGHSKDGVDCSDFVCILYQTVFDRSISGTAGNLYEQCETVGIDSLKEGDLVFFKIKSNHVSHVGVYLQNNKFVHASVHSGVVIDDLSETYYKKYFYKAGRILKA